MSKIHKWTNEQLDYLQNNTKGCTLNEIISNFNKTFNLNLTETQIKWRLKRCGIEPRNGKRGVKVGTPSKLKGRKRENLTEKQRACLYQKGRCGDRAPIGTERVVKKGYIYIKTAQPSVWELKAKVVWERHHKRKIPKDYHITYLDRNRQNLNIDNLEIVENGVNISVVNKGMYTTEADINKSVIELVKLERKIKECKKSRKKQLT